MSELIVQDGQSQKGLSLFSNPTAFEAGQRMAKALASSDIVPKEYKGNIANCLIALEVAMAVGSSPIMVMQNLNIVHGRPSWSSTYVLGVLESSPQLKNVKIVTGSNGKKKFENVRINTGGNDERNSDAAKQVTIEVEDHWAYVTAIKDGEPVKGITVSVGMAIAEGWYGRKGSKWPNMAEQMVQYRAASLFGRIHAAGKLGGFKTVEETLDIDVEVIETKPAASGINVINEKVKEKAPVPPPVVTAVPKQEEDGGVLPNDDQAGWNL